MLLISETEKIRTAKMTPLGSELASNFDPSKLGNYPRLLNKRREETGGVNSGNDCENSSHVSCREIGL